jgi:transcriptional regulator with XRE-family HTH domain
MLKVLRHFYRKRNMAEATEDETIGKMVARLRELKGWTQLYLAVRAGCDKDTVSKIERGVSEGAIGTHINIAAALDISMNDLTAKQTKKKRDELDANDRLMGS